MKKGEKIMKKMNKKGFTIVELVIVIAVIAILAAVMIPTFGGIIKKANKSSAEQTANALWKEAYAADLADGTIDGLDNKAPITVTPSKAGATASYGVDATSKKIVFTYNDGNFTVTCTDNTTWNTSENTK
jgi:prepilin-type N-terminal cleavage/methylation domain-containing protein